MIRKATEDDLVRVAEIYRKIHAEEQAGRCSIGWDPEIYPVEKTAADALLRNELFVFVDENDMVVASAIINQQQLDSYTHAPWTPDVNDNEVMVLHTLTVDPKMEGRGIGGRFVRFYEEYARGQGCRSLRLDTQSCNKRARRLYPQLGYREVSVVDTTFQGIRDIKLVLFEKMI